MKMQTYEIYFSALQASLDHFNTLNQKNLKKYLNFYQKQEAKGMLFAL